ncbi:hypothetical protein VTN96DRAFT_5060 [Rasamsonia emersonii]
MGTPTLTPSLMDTVVNSVSSPTTMPHSHVNNTNVSDSDTSLNIVEFKGIGGGRTSGGGAAAAAAAAAISGSSVVCDGSFYRLGWFFQFWVVVELKPVKNVLHKQSNNRPRNHKGIQQQGHHDGRNLENNFRQTDGPARAGKNDGDPDHHKSTREIKDLTPVGTSEGGYDTVQHNALRDLALRNLTAAVKDMREELAMVKISVKQKVDQDENDTGVQED